MTTTQPDALPLLLCRAIANAEREMRFLHQTNAHDLVEVVRHSHAVLTAAKDVRALGTAIAHGAVSPRPDLSAVASAQAVTPSGLRRRYAAAILGPLNQLNSGGPVNAEALVASLDSLGPADLLSINEQLDHSIESTFGTQPPSALAKETLATRVIEALPRLSEILKNQDLEVHPSTGPPSIPRNDLTYQLLGQLWGALATADLPVAFKGKPDVPGSRVSIEWEAGPSIDQVLALVLPLESKGTIVSGIPGLQAGRHNAMMMNLTWSNGAESIDVRLVRS